MSLLRLRDIRSIARRTWKHHGGAMDNKIYMYEPESQYMLKMWKKRFLGKTHHDMGEWTQNNTMLYPPLEEGQPRRPFEIYWGRAQVAGTNHGRPLSRLCFSIQNMNVEEALATMYNIKGAESKDSLHVYEMLREALDYAAKEVEFPMNMHVAECFAVDFDIQVTPMGGLQKQEISNIYVLLREGPAPDSRPAVTTNDAAEHYLDLHRNKKVPMLW